MGKHKPRSGSLAFYPRKRAKRQLATFTTFKKGEEKTVKPMNFVGYKAGMVSVVGKDEHPKSVSFGQEIVAPATVIECPPLKVFGVRAYGIEGDNPFVLSEVTIEKPGKFLRKKIVSFKQHHSKKKKAEDKKPKTVAWLDEIKNDVFDVRLLVATSPDSASFGQKKPDLFEVFLSGSLEQKVSFAKERLGKEVTINEVFRDKDFADVRAVDKGKGFAGVVKRFGVKIHRPKAKKHRYVGSIGPWNPSTVMWTVARPGQLGYQSRTELNKRVLVVGSDPTKVNLENGFRKYGFVKNNYVLLAGSVPGPQKRAVSLRAGIRKAFDKFNLSGVHVLGLAGKKVETIKAVKAGKIEVKEEEKKEHKSVEEEIASAWKK